MADLSLLLTLSPDAPPAQPKFDPAPAPILSNSDRLQRTSASPAPILRQPTPSRPLPTYPQFTRPTAWPTSQPTSQPTSRPTFQPVPAPRSGGQLYQQRVAALQAGQIHTQLPAHSFEETWRHTTQRPTYEQWRRLLSSESSAIAHQRDRSNLAVLLGDSLSLWFPTARLPRSSTWLNQGISGETTSGLLKRSTDFASARPDTIYIMAGINDLKRGIGDREILQNLTVLVQRLRHRHPQAQIILQSILPTRSTLIPNQRIARLNRAIAQLAQQQRTYYLDTHAYFAASDGYLKASLTTDGIHLNENGYTTWQSLLRQSESYLAQHRTNRTIAAR